MPKQMWSVKFVSSENRWSKAIEAKCGHKAAEKFVKKWMNNEFPERIPARDCLCVDLAFIVDVCLCSKPMHVIRYRVSVASKFKAKEVPSMKTDRSEIIEDSNSDREHICTELHCGGFRMEGLNQFQLRDAVTVIRDWIGADQWIGGVYDNEMTIGGLVFTRSEEDESKWFINIETKTNGIVRIRARNTGKSRYALCLEMRWIENDLIQRLVDAAQERKDWGDEN